MGRTVPTLVASTPARLPPAPPARISAPPAPVSAPPALQDAFRSCPDLARPQEELQAHHDRSSPIAGKQHSRGRPQQAELHLLHRLRLLALHIRLLHRLRLLALHLKLQQPLAPVQIVIFTSIYFICN